MAKEICFVTIYRQNVDFLESIFEKYDLNDVEAFCVETPEVVNLVQKLAQEGTKAIICRGGVASILKANANTPIVELKYSVFDFLEPVQKAYTISNRVALVGWYRHIKNFYKYKQMLNKNLMYVEMDDLSSIDSQTRVENLMQELHDYEGIDVFVGGGNVVNAAKKLHFSSCYIELDKNSVLEAIEEARYYVNVHAEREKRIEMINSVLNSVFEGVIAVDEEGMITNINAYAKTALGIGQAEQAIGFPLTKYIKDEEIHRAIHGDKSISNKIIELKAATVVLNTTAIRVGRDMVGTVVILQEVEAIKSLEKKIRRNVIESGHFAKKNFQDIIGSSTAIEALKEKARRFALSNSTVLIYGETGTGKELFAQSIHNASSRKHNPFVAINCAALPESILESELFGYVKGAFTGAKAEGKAGVFEIANKGTIFLDEIGEISMKVQTRLLRVLQEKEIARIGDNKIIPVDVRILAATNKNLKKEVEEGRFREDLYYRLCVLNLFIIPLRERKEDIPEIMEKLLSNMHQQGRKFDKGAMDCILQQDWTGNIRELSNFIERVCVLSDGQIITKNCVCEALDINPGEKQGYKVNTNGSIRLVDKNFILKTLAECNGNKRETARRLGISTTTLWRRLREEE